MKEFTYIENDGRWPNFAVDFNGLSWSSTIANFSSSRMIYSERRTAVHAHGGETLPLKNKLQAGADFKTTLLGSHLNALLRLAKRFYFGWWLVIFSHVKSAICVGDWMYCFFTCDNIAHNYRILFAGFITSNFCYIYNKWYYFILIPPCYAQERMYYWKTRRLCFGVVEP